MQAAVKRGSHVSSDRSAAHYVNFRQRENVNRDTLFIYTLFQRRRFVIRPKSIRGSSKIHKDRSCNDSDILNLTPFSNVSMDV